ncbi:hypothetical protein D9G77_22880 [Escherichia coli]|nr:hypothetical protein [Escherichia coli]
MPCGDEEIITNSLFFLCKINIKNSRGFVKKISIYAAIYKLLLSMENLCLKIQLNVYSEVSRRHSTFVEVYRYPIILSDSHKIISVDSSMADA